MECKHKIQLKSGLIVPCGKCPVCMSNYRQEWVFRLRVEEYNSAFSLFVTLTYDDEHIPADMSVNKRDAQLFFKRLRKRIGKFRYYFISEYGDHTKRPHYHALFFFPTLPDQRKIYDQITESWSNGFCKFGQVEEASIVYCTKYCLKKNDVPFGRKNNFRLVSKMSGGLGYQYIGSMIDWHVSQQQIDFVSFHGKTCRTPKYYKDFFRGGIKFNFPDYDLEREQLFLDRSYNEHLVSFETFIKGKHFATLKDAQDAFNRFKVDCSDRESDLIIKHTQKQKM